MIRKTLVFDASKDHVIDPESQKCMKKLVVAHGMLYLMFAFRHFELWDIYQQMYAKTVKEGFEIKELHMEFCFGT